MSDFARISTELADLRAELRRVAADARHDSLVLARAIRRGRVEVTAQAHNEAWQRLTPDVSLVRWRPRPGESPQTPDLSGSLVARLRAGDPVADTIGNVNTAGRANLLANPLFEGLAAKACGTVGAKTIWGRSFTAWYVTNSGATHVPQVANEMATGAGNNPLNTTICKVTLGSEAGGAHDTTAYVASSAWTGGGGAMAQYPYLTGAMVVGVFGGTSSAKLTKLNVWLELYREDFYTGANGVVAATSPVIDLRALSGSYEMARLSVVVREPGSGWGAYQWALRLCVNAAYSSGAGSTDIVRFGEPQLSLSASQSPPPFSPIIGTWVPGALMSYSGAEFYARTELNAANGLRFGPGTSSPDTNLYRSAADRLKTDDEFEVGHPNSTDNAIHLRVGNDANAMFTARTDGRLEWGAGGASARNTNLYRGADDQLKTDDNFLASGYIWTTFLFGMSEISDPSNASANEAHLFVKDNGSGKTQLCVKFSSGASIVLATQV